MVEIKTYQGYIDNNQKLIEINKSALLYRLKKDYGYYIESNVKRIEELRKENEFLRTFIESLKYVKTGE